MEKARKNSRRTAQEPPTVRRTILVIDSDPIVGELLRGYLAQQKGFQLFESKAGAEGIEAAVRHLPDVIFLGFRLDDMGGLEAHEALRQNPVTKDIPVIYVSSFFTLRTVEKATVKGAKGFISRPFTISKIHNKLNTVLGPS
jgi:CheY-like chemotaxis protein